MDTSDYMDGDCRFRMRKHISTLLQTHHRSNIFRRSQFIKPVTFMNSILGEQHMSVATIVVLITELGGPFEESISILVYFSIFPYFFPILLINYACNANLSVSI